MVSLTSPGAASLRSGSVRSSRLVASPSERKKAVTPAGPPSAAITKLAAVLSLTESAASQNSASDIESGAILSCVIGE